MPANNTNIPQYSAADLLRYASGRMPAPEMHQLEKAALEDPFLAEALDGYMDAMSAESEPVLQKQINRLPPVEAEKEKTKVIPLWRSQALQIAIAAAVILGGGWWIFSLVNQPKTAVNNVAVTQPAAQPGNTPDTVAVASPLVLDSDIAAQPTIVDTAFQSPTLAQIEQDQPAATKPTIFQQKQEVAVASAPAKPYALNEEVVKAEAKDMADENVSINRRADSTAAMVQTLNGFALKKETKSKPQTNAAARVEYPYAFYGKVTDAQNNPLPYTNVMINGQELGTYSDAQGNFNFISQDSSLSVRTRSLGYLAQNLTLQPGVNQNNIVLQEDEKLKNNLTTITTPKQQRNASNTVRPMIVERDSIEGVEPTIGRADYSLYVANNNRINVLPDLGKEVQLNFELDKHGNPTNITVAQSSGEALDNEAIRLLKEGPKWKGKKGKKGKITLKF